MEFTVEFTVPAWWLEVLVGTCTHLIARHLYSSEFFKYKYEELRVKFNRLSQCIQCTGSSSILGFSSVVN